MSSVRAATCAGMAMFVVAGCNSIFGVDDLTLRGPASSTGRGGQAVGGGGGSGGGHTGGSGGGEREPVTVWAAPIEFDSANEVDSGYSLNLKFNHQELVTDGLAEADGSDLRILYDDGSGSLVQLDRVLDPFASFNTDVTKVWWRAQEDVKLGTSRGSYYLAYGALGPTLKRDPHAVYLVWEDFNDASEVSGTFSKGAGGATASATVQGGLLNISSSNTHIGGTSDKMAFYYWHVTGSFEVDSDVVAVNNPVDHGRLGGLMARTSLQSGAASHWFGPVGAPDNYGAVTRDSASATAEMTYSSTPGRVPLLCRMRLLGDTSRSFGAPDDGTVFYLGGNTFDPVPPKVMLVGIAHSSEGSATSGASIDWIRIRARVGSGPQAKLLPAAEVSWTPQG